MTEHDIKRLSVEYALLKTLSNKNYTQLKRLAKLETLLKSVSNT